MFRSFFYNSVLGTLIGNLLAIFKKREKPVWVSKFYISYIGLSGILPAVFLGLIFSIAGYLFLWMMHGNREYFLFILAPSFLFVFGVMLLMQTINYLNRIFVYTDRIEIKRLNYTTSVIPYSNVVLVLRDKTTQSFVDVIYKDEIYGITGLVGKYFYWDVPADIFTKGNLRIDKEKIHKNVFSDYSLVKDTLPEYPVEISEANLEGQNRNIVYLFKISLLIFNPFSVTLFFVILLGIFYSTAYFYIAVDLSNAFTPLAYKYLTSKTTRLAFEKL